MIDSRTLVPELGAQVHALEADLHQRDKGARDLEVTLAAIAWVLATVLVRFSEDNQMTEAPHIVGSADRLTLARERQAAYFQRNPARTDREWIVAGLESLSTSAATTRLFDPLHHLMALHPISHIAARRLLDFWRRLDQSGGLIYDFADADRDTSFLADLYQDVSEPARRAYSLMKTPEFIEEFILQHTLDPAIAEFGLRPPPPSGRDDLPNRLRVVDPACGSGTFLLGAFRRLLAAWEDERPGADRGINAKKALESVHGVDKNPIAVVICRFRLLVAAMRAAGWRRIADVPDLPIVVATGDSLIPPTEAASYPGGRHDQIAADVDRFTRPGVALLARGSYHVVVTNPPYITVKDADEHAMYRSLYAECRGMYSLVVPFTVRSFQLARQGDQAGYVGMLVANSFTKREFGRALVEDFLSTVDLTYVIDTSGVYIPGHVTPTMILAARARAPRAPTVRAALGIRGEIAEPYDPARGMVWQAIVSQVSRPGSASEWISVGDTDRQDFAKHPWSLSGAGGVAADLLRRLTTSRPTLADHSERIGVYGATGADDALTAPAHVFREQGAEVEATVTVVTGSDVRDWGASADASAFFPGSDASAEDIARLPRHHRRLWPVRTTLRARPTFSGTLENTGRPWYAWHQVSTTPGAHPWFIVFSRIATHPHFAVLRDGSAPLQSALVVRLPHAASASDFFGLEGLLNSSAACYWLKYHSYAKGAPGADQLRADEPWGYTYEFTGAQVQKLPVPERLPVTQARELDGLATLIRTVLSSSMEDRWTPIEEGLLDAQAKWEHARGRMIAVQEELDWDVYHAYGLVTDEDAAKLVADPETVPEVDLGERAFEIVLARRMRDEGFQTQWFERHRSTPVCEIPAHWPDEYKAVVERRINAIQENLNIGLIERPECKRRWQFSPWDDTERKALTAWLLDRCGERALWFGLDGEPAPKTLNQLADKLREDPDVVSVARLLKSASNVDLAKVLAEIIDGEHVPFLAQFRYKAEGLAKRRQWEETWDWQRHEDMTGKRLDIPVPPRYRNSDFARPSYWRNRGKFDMPGERFISYPGATPDSDGSLLLGWAGWDHREQAQALCTLIEERACVDGWARDRVVPLLAGLAEVMPWVRQWHDQVDPRFAQSPADAFDAYLSARLETSGLTEESLRSWTAPPVRRGRPPKRRPAGTRAFGHLGM